MGQRLQSISQVDKLMADFKKVEHWLEDGKQLGKVISYKCGGKTFWSSVGIQKWQNYYKVYIDEIEEDKMASEEYARDEIKKFSTLTEALEFIQKNTKINTSDLNPCRGQKIFNPNFE